VHRGREVLFCLDTQAERGRGGFICLFISLSGRAGRETQREIELGSRDKREEDADEGIVEVHLDVDEP